MVFTRSGAVLESRARIKERYTLPRSASLSSRKYPINLLRATNHPGRASTCAKLYHGYNGLDFQPSESMKFGRPKPQPQLVSNGRFELKLDGHIAFLEYNLTGKVLQLIHTEVPEALRGKGLASALAESALQWARKHQVKVDVICPYVASYLKKHPEYSDLVMK